MEFGDVRVAVHRAPYGIAHDESPGLTSGTKEPTNLDSRVFAPSQEGRGFFTLTEPILVSVLAHPEVTNLFAGQQWDGSVGIGETSFESVLD